MNPGKLNRRITFQKQVEEQDENGFPIQNGWTNVKTVWAMVKTLQGRDFYQAATTNHENTSRFVIRYTKGISPDMRIKFKSRLFTIVSIINDDELNRTLTIVVEEVT